VIAACAFTIVWNSRRFVDNDYFTYVGVSFLFFAFLDLLHLLGNKNMGVFPGYGNLGPTFYIASRYVLSISLITAPLFINRKLNTTVMFGLYSLATTLILLSVFYWKVFPVCIVEGVGLTPFKVISDYIICLILLGAIALLLANRRSFDARVRRIIVASIGLSIACGLTFTLYADPFGVTNMVGHLFQIGSFYLVYVAIIETSMTKPQEILFRKLKQHEEKLTENVLQLDHTNAELQQEIAERRQTERALRESEHRWATTLSSIGDAVIAADTAGRITFMNPVAEDLTGWPLSGAASRPVSEVFNIISEQTRDRVDSPLDKVLREGTVAGLANHTLLVGRDGREIPIDDSGAPIRDELGEIEGVVLVFRDITERRLTEAALEESEKKYRNLFTNMTEEVHFWQVVRGEDGRIQTWRLVDANPPTLKSWGKELPEIRGRTTDEIFGPGATEHYMPVVQKIITEGVPHYFEDYFPHLDKYFRFTSVPVGDYFITTGADITAIKKAQDALQKAHDQLEKRVEERTAELRRSYDKLTVETRERELAEAQLRQAQKMEALGTVTGGIAHDFNNILAAVIGFTEIAKDRIPSDSKVQRQLSRVLEAGLRGRDLVKHMLQFSRQTEQEKKPLPLSSVVKETLKLMRASIPSTISIRTHVKGESGYVLADPVQMQQVVMNLCTNSAYAMREKGGVLDVGLSEFSVSSSNGNPDGIKPGLYLRLEVRDTGSGIPPEIVDRIFDPFFTTKKPGEGTGLGLSVVHGIVKQHEGYITVESNTGEGTSFSIYLPMVPEEQPAESLTEEIVLTGNERVLFVDDEEALAEMGQHLLEELGYVVTATQSSIQALSAVKADPFAYDLIVTDMTMPEMTGVELAKAVLALRPDMPVILCTGFSHLVDAEQAKAAGIKAFTMKPLTRREIGKTIREVLLKK
jgi:PAS domain S-box-containing protein